jgi:hypothetical protein
VSELVDDGSFYLAGRLHCVAREHDMDAIRSHGLHLAARAVLTMLGALLLWLAPASVAGLVVMLIGLIWAASGLWRGISCPMRLMH